MAVARSQASSRARDFRQRLLRISPLTVVVGAVALVMMGQLIEDIADSEPLQLLTPADSIRRWTLIVAVAYMLAISRVVDQYVHRAVAGLAGAVRVSSERLRDYATLLARPPLFVDALLLALAALVVTSLFWFLRTSLPIDDPVTHLPLHLRDSGGVAALIILAQYAIVGWAVLSLVVCTIGRARALARLSHEPLEIDVFDTANLLPLGNIALATALAPAGVVVILLAGFGRPSSPVSWSLLSLVTLASLIALILPLRGIHRQMEAAKGKVLGVLNGELREVYDRTRATTNDVNEATLLNHRASTLANLRRTVTEMTTWPFLNTLAFTRALLIAAAPLIYAVTNELIRVLWIVPLTQ